MKRTIKASRWELDACGKYISQYRQSMSKASDEELMTKGWLDKTAFRKAKKVKRLMAKNQP